MSRLARFQNKPKEIEFELIDENGKKIKEKLIVKPFKTTEIDLFVNIADANKRAAVMHDMIKKILKENIPDFTEEEYRNMDYAFADRILDTIMEVNGSEMSDSKRQFIEDIKAKQKAAGIIK